MKSEGTSKAGEGLIARLVHWNESRTGLNSLLHHALEARSSRTCSGPDFCFSSSPRL